MKEVIKKTFANVFASDLVIPPNGQPQPNSKYNKNNKFFYSDGSLRSLIYNFETLSANFIQQEIYRQNPVYLVDINKFIGFNIKTFKAERIIIDQVNKQLDNNIRFKISNNLPKCIDLRNFGPPVYNQGKMSSCYANGTSTTLAYTYARSLLKTYRNPNEVKEIIKSILPSRVYLEYLMQIYRDLYQNNNPFDQDGYPNILGFILEKTEGLPLENNYSYPELNNYDATSQPYINFDEKTKIYLIEEWTKKKIYTIDPILKDINKATPFYNNIKIVYALFKDEKPYSPLFKSPNNLWGLAQKQNSNGQLLWYDSNGKITTKKTSFGVPKYSGEERVKLYKSILNNKYAIAISFQVFSNWNYKNPNILYSNNPEKDFLGGHCVTFCGYNDNHKNPDCTTGAFRIQNSWGTDVGENGFYWMSYSWISKMLSFKYAKINATIFISMFYTLKLDN